MIKTYLLILFSFFQFLSFATEHPFPKAKHVILIGLDGMGAHDFQQASAPQMKKMAKEGAISLKARCVLESSSSQNWMTMLTGAIPIQHGVTSNQWEPNKHNIAPTLKNKAGFYPSIFDDIKNQKPFAKAYFFYEWDGLARMFDMSVPDKVVFGKIGVKMFYDAIDSFFADKPDFLFIDVDETDNAGHVSGHESKEFYGCITKYDSIIGQLTERLKKEQMLDDTVVIITSDHGGIKKGHGGDSSLEMEIPVILYGGTVTKGKVIEGVNLIADIAPTVAGLLGIAMPADCVGRFISAAFEP